MRLLEGFKALLSDGKPARLLEVTPEDEPTVRSFNLLTAKPMLYAANVAEGDAAHGNDHVRALEAAIARAANARRLSSSPRRSKRSSSNCRSRNARSSLNRSG